MNGINHGKKSTARPLLTSQKTSSKLWQYLQKLSESYSKRPMPQK
jgi:hypothetical protein